jgi:glucose/arabinose dehydrogenase
MKKSFKIVLIITVLALALAACSSTSQSSTAQGNPPSGQMQGTPPAGAPQSGDAAAAPATDATATVAATAAVTETATPEATAAPTATATPVTVDLTVISAIGCVAGPSESAAFAGYLKTGAELTALGRNASNTFYLIDNPSSEGNQCWVWNNYVLINGISSDLPVVE